MTCHSVQPSQNYPDTGPQKLFIGLSSLSAMVYSSGAGKNRLAEFGFASILQKACQTGQKQLFRG